MKIISNLKLHRKESTLASDLIICLDSFFCEILLGTLKPKKSYYCYIMVSYKQHVIFLKFTWRDQVNLLADWPNQSSFNQKQTNNISYKILANWIFLVY